LNNFMNIFIFIILINSKDITNYVRRFKQKLRRSKKLDRNVVIWELLCLSISQTSFFSIRQLLRAISSDAWHFETWVKFEDKSQLRDKSIHEYLCKSSID
jgi:hypothetical protein